MCALVHLLHKQVLLCHFLSRSLSLSFSAAEKITLNNFIYQLSSRPFRLILSFSFAKNNNFKIVSFDSFQRPTTSKANEFNVFTAHRCSVVSLLAFDRQAGKPFSHTKWAKSLFCAKIERRKNQRQRMERKRNEFLLFRSFQRVIYFYVILILLLYRFSFRCLDSIALAMLESAWCESRAHFRDNNILESISRQTSEK